VIFYNVRGGPIEFSYYVLYLVVGGLTRHLLLRKIPNTFLTLRDTGAFKEGTLERLMNSLPCSLYAFTDFTSGKRGKRYITWYSRQRYC
jgi:hypothetical protein